MKFNIVYDKPCRIRFRCGGYVFEKLQEYSIYKKLTDTDFVKKAEISSENGGILVYYKEGFRQKVIELVSGIDTRKLEIIPADPEYGITEIDRDFKDRIISVTAKKLFSKLFIPMAVRKYMILFRGLKFVIRGLRTLLNGYLTVDVLDGASIGACLLQRNYKTASVIMVGDGINDAPSLAAANASVAMSDASDIARGTADITLCGADLTELVRLRKLSELLMERIHTNYRFILLFNSALLLSRLCGIISPSLSAFLHNVSTMAICGRSMTGLIKDDTVKGSI